MVIEWIQANPRLSIISFALGVSFFISLVNYFVLDKEKMHYLKGRQKEISKQMREHQKSGNHEKAMELNKEMIPLTLDLMKHSFKSVFITAIPLLFLFGYMRGAYAETTIASSWLWWYIASSFVGVTIFRKLFRLP